MLYRNLEVVVLGIHGESRPLASKWVVVERVVRNTFGTHHVEHWLSTMLLEHFAQLIRSFQDVVVIPNMPPVMHLIVVPIEFISTFILRPVTLTIRLMANMLSGHLILALIFGATNFFFWQLNGWTALSAVTLVAAILFTLFELLVIFLQAYIFALLVAVYIDLSLHASEH